MLDKLLFPLDMSSALAFIEGAEACEQLQPQAACPYVDDEGLKHAWLAGWRGMAELEASSNVDPSNPAQP